MNVLVTGATGFVGSAITRALARQGHSVLALVRSPAKAEAIRAECVEPALGDMWQPSTYVPLVARVEAVIHAAQQLPSGRWSRRQISEMHRSDALMTRELALACLAQSKPLIYTSGALTHRGRGDEWIDERTPARPCLLARGHAEMERELFTMHRERGLRVIVMSPTFVYGGGGLLKLTSDLLRQKQYRVIGNGQNYCSLVHVDDVADAYVLALARGRIGESYFLADGAPLRRREFVDRLSDAFDLPRVGHVPGWLVGLLMGFPMVEALSAPLRVRSTKAREELGWRPQFESFGEGLPNVLPGLL